MTPRQRGRNWLLLGVLVAVVVGMVGLTYAAVPLYSVFCRVTGFGGTTRRAAVAPTREVNRIVTIRFNADVNPELPWQFAPEQHQIRLKLGETGLIAYRATNHGSVPIVGTAVYNVTPAKAGLYFDKIQCFCFTAQTLNPGQTAELPVAFFVDPAMASDRNLDDVNVITLSYTFYRAKGSGPQASRDDTGSGSPAAVEPGSGGPVKKRTKG